jgi:putrescine importer
VPATVSDTTSSAAILSAWDLVIFGVLCVTPIAPLPLFGIAQRLSHGHATTSILLGMIAMVFTAISYGRMAALYPSAGSAFSYIGNVFNPHLGFVAGWAMLLDYLLIPTINVIYCAVAIHRFAPVLPYPVLGAGLAGLITWLNLRGLKTGARTNWLMMIIICAVLVWFASRALQFLHGASIGSEELLHPLFGPEAFDAGAMLTATSFAALTYIGFDSVTTLAENVAEPKRSVPFAAVCVCLLTGLGGGALVYLSQLVWPRYDNFANLETAFLDITHRVGGGNLLVAFTAVILLAQFASAFTGQAGAGRLLGNMSRKGALPSWFGRSDAGNGQPRAAIMLIGALAFAGSLFLSFEQGAELLNFGAFMAFMGVNLASLKTLYARRGRGARWVWAAAVPALGFIFCLLIWLGLSPLAKIAGGGWLALGVVYQGVRSRGFRGSPAERGDTALATEIQERTDG